jgi:hypothetical protein
MAFLRPMSPFVNDSMPGIRPGSEKDIPLAFEQEVGPLALTLNHIRHQLLGISANSKKLEIILQRLALTIRTPIQMRSLLEDKTFKDIMRCDPNTMAVRFDEFECRCEVWLHVSPGSDDHDDDVQDWDS